ncbi:hypothetical protein M8C21_001581, partial [Ambrosia artemisiifolia]
ESDFGADSECGEQEVIPGKAVMPDLNGRGWINGGHRLIKFSNAVDTLSPTEHIRDGDTIVSSGGMFEMGFFNPGNSKNRYLGIWYKKVSYGTVVWVANRDRPLNTTSGILKVSSNAILQLVSVVDTLSPTEHIRDGDTIVSSGGMFEMGFFNPGNSKNRYLGIWYKKVSYGTVVWVANRDRPLNTTSGILQVSNNGILQLVSVVAQLLDNGNLVIREGSRIIWQSFDYPGDTYLPGMKIGSDLSRGIDRQWTTWKSLDDPSPGQYVIWMDTNGFPQIFEKRGSVLHMRFGPWNGVRYSGMPSLRESPIFGNKFVINEKEIYYQLEEVDSSVVMRMYLNPEGVVTRMIWIDRTQSWLSILAVAPTDSGSPYGLCGPYGTCNSKNFPICSCLDGFVPKRAKDWKAGDWTSGCELRTPLECGDGNAIGFKRVSGVKLPDTRSSRYNLSMNLWECEMECRRHCECTAYANLYVIGSGCLLWFDNLMDIREADETQDLYIRMALSELPSFTTPESASNKKKNMIIAVVSTLICLVLIGLTLAVYASMKKSRSYLKGRVHDFNEDTIGDGPEEDVDLPSFSLSTIFKSTNNFSTSNKLGEGGFGPVYKGGFSQNPGKELIGGVLDDGREIAVKQLSKSSRQGLDEFKNEVRCIAKLQHRNLVKLLGYCIEGDETMLIYEFMANR